MDAFDPKTIEMLARILGDTSRGFTGREIGQMLSECRIPDIGPSTKWERIYNALGSFQSETRNGKHIVRFIHLAMKPVRHHDAPEWFHDTRQRLNQVLAFEGLTLRENGRLQRASVATTISEARKRAASLRSALASRGVHPDVLVFCREELLADNYFHAVFEATKSVAAKIRDRTGLTSDGAALVDEALTFNSRVPHIALTRLESESEQSEQKGFAHLLKGLFGTFRNPAAHEPRVRWEMSEADALDILSIVSLVHRRLDGASTPVRDFQP